MLNCAEMLNVVFSFQPCTKLNLYVTIVQAVLDYFE